MLDVADPTLVLAFDPGAVGRADDRPHAPVPGKRVQAIVEFHLVRGRIVVLDQRTSIVEQEPAGHAAEMAECPYNSFQPGRSPLMSKGPRIDTPRIAERRHEQIHFGPLAPDHDPALAKVDLQLAAWRRPGPAECR